MSAIRSVLLLALVLTPLNTACGQAPAADPDPVVATTNAFTFRSNFWVNLHDYLYGRAQNETLAAETTDCLATLSEEDRTAWETADAFYRDHMGDRHHRTDDLMKSLRYDLAQLAKVEATAEHAEVMPVLRRAAPAYRACWWTAHDTRNRAWIATLIGYLETYEAAMTEQLSAYHQRPWPENMPVDVVTYASWAGANTIVEPNHLMMSSVDAGYKEASAFEMVFHEASHTLLGYRTGKTAELLHEASATYNEDPPSNLWHVILFYTSGRLAQQLLADDGVDYTPYMYQNGVFRDGHPLMEAHWQPYLDGEVDLETAVQHLMEAIYGG